MKPPLEPTGHPGLPEKDPRLPEAQEGVPQELRILKSERMWQEGDILKIRGLVHVQYRGYDIYAREVDANRATNVFILRGGANLIGKDAVIVGDTIEVDYNARTFRAYKSDSELRPSLLKGYVLDNVYLQGGEVWGSENRIFGHDCGLTTCTYDKPHYMLDTRDLDLRVGKRIILRHVRLEILGKTILTLPFVSIPLDTRREGYTPEVGRTPQEGYFIKTKWGIPLKGPNDLLGYVDYFEKLGIGLGGRYRYSAENNEGYFRAYGLTGETDTVEIQAGHRQRLSRDLMFQIENNFQQRNFLNAPQNTLFNTRMSLNLNQGRNRSRLTLNRNSNESPTFKSTSQTIGLSDTRLWSKDTRTQLDVSWARSESQFSTGGSEREQVDVRFKGQHDLKKALAELEYQRSIPVGEISSFFSASDRTPVLTLRTDSQRLFGKPIKLPFQSELSMGEFIDPVEKQPVTRTNFDIRGAYRDQSERRFKISGDGRFKQSFYSDDTAQFAVGYGVEASYRLGQASAATLRYNFLEPEGFTPLAIDRIGRSNLATADVSVKPSRSLTLGLQTGYDFLQIERGEPTAWQPVGLRMDYRPHDWLQLRALPIYDPFNRLWSSVRVDLAYVPGATYVALGAKYDGFRKTWGSTNIFVDGFKFGRAKISGLLAYNGYLKRFDERHVSVTYDLHCAEAILQMRESNFGFRPGREFYFFIRLKAFPFNTPFGLSRRGAPLGTGTGLGGF